MSSDAAPIEVPYSTRAFPKRVCIASSHRVPHSEIGAAYGTGVPKLHQLVQEHNLTTVEPSMLSVWYGPPEGPEGIMTFDICLIVQASESELTALQLPEGTKVVVVPKGEHGIFTYRGPCQHLGNVYSYVCTYAEREHLTFEGPSVEVYYNCDTPEAYMEIQWKLAAPATG